MCMLRKHGVTSIVASALMAVLAGFVSGCESTKPQNLFAGFYHSTSEADERNPGVVVVSANRETIIPWVVVDGTLHLLVGEIEIDDLVREKERIGIKSYSPEENELRNAIEQHPWLKETLPPRSEWPSGARSVLWSDYLDYLLGSMIPVPDVVGPAKSDSKQPE